MANIILRPATIKDAARLAEVSIMASQGTFELLLKGLKRGVTVHQVMTKLVQTDTEYSYRYFTVAEVDGQFAGAVNALSVEDRYRLAPNINPILQREFGFGWWQLIKFLIRARHLKGMNQLRSPRTAFHLNDVAVLPEFQGMGIGKALVQAVIQQGQEAKCSHISLNVWTDNTGAIALYKKLGFVVSGTAPVRPHRYLPHSAAHLMLLSLA